MRDGLFQKHRVVYTKTAAVVKDATYDPMLRERYNVRMGREPVSKELQRDITDGWNICS